MADAIVDDTDGRVSIQLLEFHEGARANGCTVTDPGRLSSGDPPAYHQAMDEVES
ncbi:MAG: hypothetical protein QOH60_2493 [Mycobacterium sp.]|nr:hypothetical protein [Mycobacterium sp.]